MNTARKKAGRPPAAWMYEIAKKNFTETFFITNEDIAEQFKTTVDAIKKFCSRAEVKIEYRSENGAIRSYYDLKSFQQSVRNYIKEKENR